MGMKMYFFSLKTFSDIFRVICVATAISVTAYCTYEFLENKDLSEVSFVEFNKDENSVYPQTSLCFARPFLEDELNIKSHIISITKTSFVMSQTIIKNKLVIVEAKIHLVFVNEKAKPIKIPKLVVDKFKPYISNF